jgi:hypothetical protein
MLYKEYIFLNKIYIEKLFVWITITVMDIIHHDSFVNILS